MPKYIATYRLGMLGLRSQYDTIDRETSFTCDTDEDAINMAQQLIPAVISEHNEVGLHAYSGQLVKIIRKVDLAKEQKIAMSESGKLLDKLFSFDK